MGKGLEARATWQVLVDELGLVSRAAGTLQSLSQEVKSKGEAPTPQPSAWALRWDTRRALSEPQFPHL